MVERGGSAGVPVSPADVLPLLVVSPPPPLQFCWRQWQPGSGLDVLHDLPVVLIVAGQDQVGVLRPLLSWPGLVGAEVLAGLPAGLLQDPHQVAHDAHCHCHWSVSDICDVLAWSHHYKLDTIITRWESVKVSAWPRLGSCWERYNQSSELGI